MLIIETHLAQFNKCLQTVTADSIITIDAYGKV